ncbi:DNA replication licensing factor MCM9 [Chondrus crispus]|uniref:DNA helicase n=1 Tax=Chondrus crispus TaxID=2769 RepID=R7QC32_CHOCR|nr:DNA replication licensing factor MCM9 [Chondrus crispus]CDF35005.1 DNA replication licensing factor MCM9 [Chondrus crispus]|eukprot:XP_005714824.1 DNA replication licensing factor MCM9 [Chondrus crispus]
MQTSRLPSEYIREFDKYLRKTCLDRIKEISAEEDDTAHYAVEIDIIAMQNIAPDGCAALLHDPQTALPLLEEAIQNLQESFTDNPKANVHARVCHLPSTPAYLKQNISALRNRDVDKLLSLLGTITRTGSVMLREVTREYICSKCKNTIVVTGDISQRGAFAVPTRCPRSCPGTKFVPLDDVPPVCREYQEVKVQEKVQHLDVGSIPRSLIVILTDDLADTVKPGDDVVVSGILYRRWNKPLIVDSRSDVELMLVALHISSNNEKKSFLHQLTARNLILKSICPQIYGMYLLKMIVAMSLIGGVSYCDPSGSRIRGESHLLIVGDPGTAKSQILRYAAKISPRSVLTTGIGTTSAGLTVTAVREAGTGEWMLDAGALVLADGGVCCIDEFDGIKNHDRGAIHEAMEQQTLSVAKAGLVCTLDTRATVLAAVNPKGGKIYFGGDQLPITVGIASPLLSRFDVVLTLLDQKNEQWDRQLSSFILNGYEAPSMEKADKIWSTERLRQYLYYIKTDLKPKLSPNAQTLLSKYYTMERASALVRLAHSHARLMFRETATALDAVFAIAAVEASSDTHEVVGGMGALHAPFPENPRQEFEKYARFILGKLGLEDAGISFYEDDAPVDS